MSVDKVNEPAPRPNPATGNINVEFFDWVMRQLMLFVRRRVNRYRNVESLENMVVEPACKN